jgi:hypothetical protein
MMENHASGHGKVVSSVLTCSLRRRSSFGDVHVFPVREDLRGGNDGKP